MISVLSVEKVVRVVFKLVQISGVCFGIEFLWNHRMMVIDIGIVRLYLGVKPIV